MVARHLMKDERDRKGELRHQGFDQDEIARHLGWSVSTISWFTEQAEDRVHWEGYLRRTGKRRRTHHRFEKQPSPRCPSEWGGISENWPSPAVVRCLRFGWVHRMTIGP